MNAINTPVKSIPAVARAFNKAYAAAKPVPFNPVWNNGTGYFNGAVKGEAAPKLAVGEVACSMTLSDEPRKLIIIGTPVGNVVVFQRYSNRDDIYTVNTTSTFTSLFSGLMSNPLTPDHMSFMVGDPEYASIAPNVGQHIVEMVSNIKAYNAATEDDVQ